MSPFCAPRSFRILSCLIAAAALAACGGVDGPATTAASTPTGDTPAPAPTAVDSATAATVAFDTSKIPVHAAGVASSQIQWTGQVGFATDIGAFRIVCDFSHMASDDPIVYPGKPGKSHLHTFFGNTGTSAGSTAESIAGSGASTCRGGTANRTAYWVPTMIDTQTGTPIKPSLGLMYYKTGYNGVKPWQVQTMPAGLRMIAGDSKNAKAEGPFKYACIGKGSEAMVGHEIQNCPVGAQVWQLIYFPQCWDGVNLDSPDHKSHMSYPVDGGCPKTHPVPLPEVSYNIVYDVTEANAPLRWRLSSDTYSKDLPGGYSAHGDWFNGWDPAVMKTFIEQCDRASKDCHANLLGDGRELI
jgi:hypothetical protein